MGVSASISLAKKYTNTQRARIGVRRSAFTVRRLWCSRFGLTPRRNPRTMNAEPETANGERHSWGSASLLPRAVDPMRLRRCIRRRGTRLMQSKIARSGSRLTSAGFWDAVKQFGESRRIVPDCKSDTRNQPNHSQVLGCIHVLERISRCQIETGEQEEINDEASDRRCDRLFTQIK
jgi:hypothetical protein